MFDRDFDNFRKVWMRDKHKKDIRKFEREDLAKCNKQLAKKNLSDEDISFLCVSKLGHLIYLSRFKEAEILIDNLFGELHSFDKNFQNTVLISPSKECLPEIYFYKGFVKSCLGKYDEALQAYDCANQLGYVFRDISFRRNKVCYEIETINKKLYGIIEGSKKNKEYFSNILKNHPDDFYSLKYLARANYFLDTKEALKNYKALLHDSLEENIYSLFFGEKKQALAYWIIAIIKCNMKIWKTENINKAAEIRKYFKKAEEVLDPDYIDYCDTQIGKKEAEDLLSYYKSVYYRLNYAPQTAEKYVFQERERFRKKIFLKRCYLYPKTKLDKIIKNKNLPEEWRSDGLKELFCNHNISFKYFKSVYDNWKVKISVEYLKNLMCSIEDQKEGEKKLKYIINTSDIKAASLTDAAEKYRFNKSFIKYLMNKKLK